LDDVLVTEKGVERSPDVGVILNDDNALIFNLARHQIKVEGDVIISSTFPWIPDLKPSAAMINDTLIQNKGALDLCLEGRHQGTTPSSLK
jgi:hypothetical protein